jgi:RimJ/RimL family protein N-acetyltransferase
VSIKVTESHDPVWVLQQAKVFLASEPVLHNLIFTLLVERLTYHEPGRYWLAMDGGKAVGLVFQSPLQFAAIVTPMPFHVVNVIADMIANSGVELPGVIGDAATAARFAGQWAERKRCAAIPFQGQRLYELSGQAVCLGTPNHLRKAIREDRDLVLEWMRCFLRDLSEPGEAAALVDRRLEAGQFWLWDDGEPGSMASTSDPAAGVVRIRYVYTPPDKRSRGYATACVSELSNSVQQSGCRCVLYTDLNNPTSNSIYRRIGYRAVAEALRYRFE